MRIFNVGWVVLGLSSSGCAVPSTGTGTDPGAGTGTDVLGYEDTETAESALRPWRAGPERRHGRQGGRGQGPNEPPISGVGESCGGFTIGPPPVCAKGLFCSYRIEDICGFADASGICVKKPVACLDKHAPVCGCDGQTYPNACVAGMNGVSVFEEGTCASVPSNAQPKAQTNGG